MKSIFFIVWFGLSLSGFSQDTIIVSIAHGSKPLKQFPQEHRTIGGIKGGHVVIEIDGFAYGFFSKEIAFIFSLTGDLRMVSFRSKR